MTTQKMSMWGIGPKIAMIAFPYLGVSIVLSYFYSDIFNLKFIPVNILTLIGLAILIIGIVFYLFTARTFLREFKNDKLITSGPYALCRNPLYCSFIVFIIPAVSLLINSWLALTTAIVMYVSFKIFIKKENEYLRNRFNEEYEEYKRNVNEIIPIPKFNR